ncbi:hypothetical protein [Streptomyces sp. HB132]|nr:hypothetical protein [Streptomyces sp. HB132]MBM7441946.1 hypothetical protein [Streptomyces sp. HB132]
MQVLELIPLRLPGIGPSIEWIETGVLLAPAGLLTGFRVRWLRRRLG